MPICDGPFDDNVFVVVVVVVVAADWAGSVASVRVRASSVAVLASCCSTSLVREYAAVADAGSVRFSDEGGGLRVCVGGGGDL